MRHDCCEVADYAVVPCPLCSFCILKRPQCLTCHTYKHTLTHSKLLLSFSAFFTPSRETAGKKMLLAHLYPLAPNHDFAELQCVCVCVCAQSVPGLGHKPMSIQANIDFRICEPLIYSVNQQLRSNSRCPSRVCSEWTSLLFFSHTCCKMCAYYVI